MLTTQLAPLWTPLGPEDFSPHAPPQCRTPTTLPRATSSPPFGHPFTAIAPRDLLDARFAAPRGHLTARTAAPMASPTSAPAPSKGLLEAAIPNGLPGASAVTPGPSGCLLSSRGAPSFPYLNLPLSLKDKKLRKRNYLKRIKLHKNTKNCLIKKTRAKEGGRKAGRKEGGRPGEWEIIMTYLEAPILLCWNEDAGEGWTEETRKGGGEIKKEIPFCLPK